MQNRLFFAAVPIVSLLIVGCSTGDPTVAEVVKESTTAIQQFASGQAAYVPANKKISITASVEDKINQDGQTIKIMHFGATNLTPKKRAIQFNSNIPASFVSKDSKDLPLVTAAFTGISACADEYDKKTVEASKVSNPLAGGKEVNSGCQFSGLTYNDQPAVDISSSKYPGVSLRLIEVRDNKYTPK